MWLNHPKETISLCVATCCASQHRGGAEEGGSPRRCWDATSWWGSGRWAASTGSPLGTWCEPETRAGTVIRHHPARRQSSADSLCCGCLHSLPLWADAYRPQRNARVRNSNTIAKSLPLISDLLPAVFLVEYMMSSDQQKKDSWLFRDFNKIYHLPTANTLGEQSSTKQLISSHISFNVKIFNSFTLIISYILCKRVFIYS